VAADAIGIAVINCIVGKGRINKAVLAIIHIYFINSGECVNNIKVFCKAPLSFRAWSDRVRLQRDTDIVAALVDNLFHVGFVNRQKDHPE